MASLGGMPTAPPPSQPDRTAARPTRIPDLQPGRSRTTERLVLRPWRDEDAEAFGSLNADPEVMTYFPAPLDRAASDELLGRARTHVDDHGWGFWALEERSTGAFIGLTGLSQPSFEAAFTPCVEIGWRLVRSAWGQGYATEAATVSTPNTASVMRGSSARISPIVSPVNPTLAQRHSSVGALPQVVRA